MTALPDKLIETPHMYAGGGSRWTVLDDILGSLRLTAEWQSTASSPVIFASWRKSRGPDHFAPFFAVQETQMSHRFVTVTLR